jgi:S-(hydroxymethyl)glutathione dehydrogenase/alcohol dehydrogenase
MISEESFKAAVLTKIAHPLEIFQLRIPELKRGQVLVKILYSAVCASQIYEVTGQRGPDRFLPHLLGHEGVGIVKGIGPGVSRFKIGQEVILTWIQQDGLSCQLPLFESIEGKQVNSGLVTTFSEYSIVAENRLFLAPKWKNKSLLPVFGCSALTGGGMVAGVKEKIRRCLVIGGGGVGTFAILALLARNAREIHLLEKNSKRRNLLDALSTTITVHETASSKSLLDEIQNNGKFDLVFECGGTAESLQKGIELTNTPGTLIFASHPKKGDQVWFDPHELISGKKIIGSWGGGCVNSRLREEVLTTFEKMEDSVERLVSRTFPLDEINEALNSAMNGSSIRVIISMSQ